MITYTIFFESGEPVDYTPKTLRESEGYIEAVSYAKSISRGRKIIMIY